MTPFAGFDLDLLADVIGDGYATWFVTEGSRDRVTTAMGARVVHAPIETVHDAATDFEGISDHIAVLARPDVQSLGGDRLRVRFNASVGLAVFKLRAALEFRFRRERPAALRMEEYLGGTFKSCALDLFFHELTPETTLLTVSFLGDVRSLSGITRYFLSSIPDLGPSIEGNMLLIPLLAMSALSERRHGFTRSRSPAARPLQERLHEVAPLLERGYVTAGQVSGSRLVDVCSATRLSASPDEVWPLVRDPAWLSRVVSFIDRGRIVSERNGELELELSYKARLGPLRKRYPIRVRAQVGAGRFDSQSASVAGEPATYGALVVPHGSDTLYAHRVYTDPRRDWLSRAFLKGQPELEQLIAQYPPLLQALALRRHFANRR